MAESTRRAGGPVFHSDEITSADQATMTGDGTWLNPLRAAGGSGQSGLEFTDVQTAGFAAAGGLAYPLQDNRIPPEPPLPPASPFNIDLPSAASVGNGGSIGFTLISVGSWQITATGGDTIVGGSPKALITPTFYLEVISDGVGAWYARFEVL